MNPLMCTDIYKIGHMFQYPKDVNFVFSYLQTRKDDKYRDVIFFGLQYYLKKYLSAPITTYQINEFCMYVDEVLKFDSIQMSDLRTKLYDLRDLGFWPLKICAVPEGTRVNNPNLLMTVENTVAGFGWVVGFFESLLLKVWNTCTVATYSYQLKQLCTHYAHLTADNHDFVKYQVHDFGYRGCSSEETAALSGAAHLLNFEGTDTISAVQLLADNYMTFEKRARLGASVPASEHSVMCCYGNDDGEIEAVRALMRLYPMGVLSIVADTYDFFGFLAKVHKHLYKEIMSRDGKIVFRPDSGDPIKILCGDPEYGRTRNESMPEGKTYAVDGREMGAFKFLRQLWGSNLNNQGFNVINPKVGLIYGDGMTQERISKILEWLYQNKFSTENIVFGVGGLLLQQHNRDDMGFTFKASQITMKDGTVIDLQKDPVTDPGKRSMAGKLSLFYCREPGIFRTKAKSKYLCDAMLDLDAVDNALWQVFNNELFIDQSINDIRGRIC